MENLRSLNLHVLCIMYGSSGRILLMVCILSTLVFSGCNYEGNENVLKEVKTYYSSGELESAYFVDDSGKIQGEMQVYFEDGGLKRSTQFLDSLRHGHDKFYYENNVLEINANYDNGVLDGVSTWYNQSGVLIDSVFFNSGEQIELYSFNDQGELTQHDKLIVQYEDTLKMQLFYKDGHLFLEGWEHIHDSTLYYRVQNELNSLYEHRKVETLRLPNNKMHVKYYGDRDVLKEVLILELLDFKESRYKLEDSITRVSEVENDKVNISEFRNGHLVSKQSFDFRTSVFKPEEEIFIPCGENEIKAFMIRFLTKRDYTDEYYYDVFVYSKP